MCGQHTMGVAWIGLKRPVLEQVDRTRHGTCEGDDLIGLAMHHQHRHGYLLEVVGVIFEPGVDRRVVSERAAAHALARYRFRGNRVIYGILFSSIIFPPQITLISLYQILVDYNLYNSLLGLTLVYISLQLPLTVYLLEGFFARIPQDLFDAAKMDGYGDIEIFRRIVLPIGMPAIATTLILNFIQLWNEFLFAVVLITDPEKRTLPIGIRAFMGDHFQDIGMIAAGVMISVIPVILAYAFFSEKLIRGMTAGAVK